ncbi:hypothetical protein KY343_04210 [Candidatus Woesearchaeota archaeon]|nr:hypothetical protein [Candidatus Woesearchaeota archaeon]
MTEITRRGFLKRFLVGAGGIATARYLPSCASQRNIDNTIKLVRQGTGIYGYAEKDNTGAINKRGKQLEEIRELKRNASFYISCIGDYEDDPADGFFTQEDIKRYKRYLEEDIKKIDELKRTLPSIDELTEWESDSVKNIQKRFPETQRSVISSADDLICLVRNTAEKHGGVSFAYLCAHGDPDEMMFSKNFTLSVSDLRTKEIKDLGKFIYGPVKLGACSIANPNVEDNFARVLSEVWQTEVEGLSVSGSCELTPELNLYGQGSGRQVRIRRIPVLKESGLATHSIHYSDTRYFAELDDNGRITIISEYTDNPNWDNNKKETWKFPWIVLQDSELSAEQSEKKERLVEIVNNVTSPFYREMLTSEGHVRLSYPYAVAAYRNGKKVA